MKRDKPANLPASIRQRLLDRAKKRGEDYNYTLSQYAIERFLYRLGQSQRCDRFVLKGASLFCLWSQEPHRATWDLDLLGRGAANVPDVEQAKDFYDLHFLATHFPFSGALLADAVRHTFDRRKTAIPDAIPVGLSDEFAAVPERSKQWNAFVRRGRLGTKVELLPLLSVLRAFLLPVLDSARKRESLKADWLPGGPWR